MARACQARYRIFLFTTGFTALSVFIFIVRIVNVIAVLERPPALIFLYLLCNDREIVGRNVS